MKTQILLPLLACVLWAHFLTVAAAEAPAQPILPLEPAALLTYLPTAPKDWIVTRSVAANMYTTWIECRAERDFRRPPPPLLPGTPAPTKPPPDVTMNVSILDTGYSTPFKASFAPKSGSPSGLTYLTINDFPAHKQTLDGGTIFLCLLVKDRYLISIYAANLSDDELQTLAKEFDFTKLASAPDTGATKLPYPITIIEVDELNPQNNRKHSVYWASPEAPRG